MAGWHWSTTTARCDYNACDNELPCEDSSRFMRPVQGWLPAVVKANPQGLQRLFSKMPSPRLPSAQSSGRLRRLQCGINLQRRLQVSRGFRIAV